MTLRDTLDELSGKAFDAIVARQEAVLSGLAETVKPLHERLGDTPLADRVPDVVGAVDRAFSFTEKVVANQHEFTVKLLETLRPAHPAHKPAARKTTLGWR